MASRILILFSKVYMLKINFFNDIHDYQNPHKFTHIYKRESLKIVSLKWRETKRNENLTKQSLLFVQCREARCEVRKELSSIQDWGGGGGGGGVLQDGCEQRILRKGTL